MAAGDTHESHEAGHRMERLQSQIHIAVPNASATVVGPADPSGEARPQLPVLPNQRVARTFGAGRPGVTPVPRGWRRQAQRQPFWVRFTPV